MRSEEEKEAKRVRERAYYAENKEKIYVQKKKNLASKGVEGKEHIRVRRAEAALKSLNKGNNRRKRQEKDRAKRANESPDVREKRLKHDRYLDRTLKEQLTTEEKQKRLSARQEYLAITREEAFKEAGLTEEDYKVLKKEDLENRLEEKTWYDEAIPPLTKREKHYAKYPARNILRLIKQRCTKKDLPFDLTEEWYNERYEKGCAVTGKAFTPHRIRSPWAANVDRIIPKIGYTQENCRLVCAGYNLAKAEWTDEEVLEMCKLVIKKQKK